MTRWLHAYPLLLLLVPPLLHAEPEQAESVTQTSPASLTDLTLVEPPATSRTTLVALASSLLDTHYRYGGTSPLTGLDCSGLVRYVYAQSVGLTLPHSARELAHGGVAVPVTDLLPGDLLFFAAPRHPVSHVGIYLGEGRFIHAASRSRKVKISDMEQRYFARRLVSVRRYLPE